MTKKHKFVQAVAHVYFQSKRRTYSYGCLVERDKEYTHAVVDSPFSGHTVVTVDHITYNYASFAAQFSSPKAVIKIYNENDDDIVYEQQRLDKMKQLEAAIGREIEREERVRTLKRIAKNSKHAKKLVSDYAKLAGLDLS